MTVGINLGDVPAWISAVADIATAGIAAFGFRQLLRTQNKRDPQHLSIWAQTAAMHGHAEVEIYAVNLLPEPAILQGVTAGPGVEFAYHPADYRTAARRHRDRHAGTPDPELTWSTLSVNDQLLQGYRSEGGYQPTLALLVRSDSDEPWLELSISFASGSRPTATHRIELSKHSTRRQG